MSELIGVKVSGVKWLSDCTNASLKERKAADSLRSSCVSLFPVTVFSLCTATFQNRPENLVGRDCWWRFYLQACDHMELICCWSETVKLQSLSGAEVGWGQRRNFCRCVKGTNRCTVALSTSPKENAALFPSRKVFFCQHARVRLTGLSSPSGVPLAVPAWILLPDSSFLRFSLGKTRGL